MTFCVITHVSHCQEHNNYFAYAPYVHEMNIWLKHIDEVIIVAPLDKIEKTAIDIAYIHDGIDFERVSGFNITNFKGLAKTLFVLPKLLFIIYKAMQKANHIHLRCPGNMGLLGCLIQIVFPKKKKTAKYAGNWDPRARQPWSYKVQKWILSNTFLTRNMQVLVYGEWENQTRNIKPFFTATYSVAESKEWEVDRGKELARNGETIKLLFVGTLSEGKRPLYAVQIVEELKKRNVEVQLDLCGEGILRKELESYIGNRNLEKFVFLKGNLSKEEIKNKYQNSHFLILPSRSEGWPKVVAEAMFWGVVPVATGVSCVANMIENRGILLSMQLEKDTDNIISHIVNPDHYREKSERAMKWSRQYTTDKFEAEIKKLIIGE